MKLTEIIERPKVHAVNAYSIALGDLLGRCAVYLSGQLENINVGDDYVNFVVKGDSRKFLNYVKTQAEKAGLDALWDTAEPRLTHGTQYLLLFEPGIINGAKLANALIDNESFKKKFDGNMVRVV